MRDSLALSSALEHPQTPRAVLALSLGLVALQAAVAPLWDADLWWLLRAGEDILREGVAPHENRYGFTAPTHPWVMHEWLLGAVGASLVRAFGLPGVALLRIAATLTVGAFAWRVAEGAFGLNSSFARQDESAHPFQSNFSRSDIRITTRVEDYWPACLFGTWHETGHAMYERGVHGRWERTPVSRGASLGVHESLGKDLVASAEAKR